MSREESRMVVLESQVGTLKAALRETEAERDRAFRVLNDIYPALAGHAIRLKNAGELNAAAIWGGICRKVFRVIVGVPNKLVEVSANGMLDSER
jgi:hypothetical protein